MKVVFYVVVPAWFILLAGYLGYTVAYHIAQNLASILFNLTTIITALLTGTVLGAAKLLKKPSSKFITIVGCLSLFASMIICLLLNTVYKLNAGWWHILWGNVIIGIIYLCYILLQRINEKYNASTICSILTIVLIAACSVGAYSVIAQRNQSISENRTGDIFTYIVVNDNTKVYKNYSAITSTRVDENAEVVTILQKGEVVERLGGIGGAITVINVRTSDGKEGWVQNHSLEVESYLPIK